jgi:hypothetical protein
LRHLRPTAVIARPMGGAEKFFRGDVDPRPSPFDLG